MANSTVNYGFEFYKNMYGNGPAQTIECEALSTYATALFVGDAVIMAAAGGDKGRMGVTQATNSSVNQFGVIASIQATSPDSLKTHAGAASTTRICLVIPALSGYIFRVKCNTVADLNDIGAEFDIVVGTGDVNSGRSRMSIDPNVTTNAQVHIIGFDNRPDNVLAAAGTAVSGVDALVRFRKSVWTNQVGIT